MLYGNYCYIFIENFPKNSFRVQDITTFYNSPGLKKNFENRSDVISRNFAEKL